MSCSTILKRETHSQTIIYTPEMPTKMYKSLSSQVMPNVIQATQLKPKIPIDSQLSAPTIVRINAITEKTLKVFFKLLSLLVSCTVSMLIAANVMHTNNGFDARQDVLRKFIAKTLPLSLTFARLFDILCKQTLREHCLRATKYFCWRGSVGRAIDS